MQNSVTSREREPALSVLAVVNQFIKLMPSCRAAGYDQLINSRKSCLVYDMVWTIWQYDARTSATAKEHMAPPMDLRCISQARQDLLKPFVVEPTPCGRPCAESA